MRLRWFEPNTCHAKAQVRPGLQTGPDVCPGAVPGPFTVPVGQLWARSGQVSGLRPARPRLRGGRGCASGTAPFGGVFPQVTALLLVSAGFRWVRLSLAVASCVRTPGG